MTECSLCVMNDKCDPEIKFDNGICNHCYRAEALKNQHRIDKDQLPWVIDQIRKRGKGRTYDCIIGLSGGVDSSYALHILKQHNLRIFAYTIDNGWNTQIADENVMKLVEGLKVPFYRYTIDRKIFRELQAAFINSGVPNAEIPTDHLITTVAWEMARREGVKTIVSGGNWQTESIMPAVFGYSAHDLYHIKQIYKRSTGGNLKGLPTTNLAQYMWYRCVDKIKIVNLLDHCDYNRARAKEELNKLYGWEDYGAKHEESVFTKWFQDVYLPKVHGLDKRRPHLSSMIHSGQMSRQEALNILKTRPDEKVLEYVELPNPHKHSDYPDHARLRRWAYKIYKHF